MKKYIIVALLILSANSLIRAHHGLEGMVSINGSSSGVSYNLQKNQLLLKLGLSYWGFNALSNEYLYSGKTNLINLSSAETSPVTLVYGLTDKLSLIGLFSYANLSYENWTGITESPVMTNVSGFMNPQIGLSYNVLSKNNWAINTGGFVKLPIGKSSSQKENINENLNTNSWDPSAMLMIMKSVNKLTFSSYNLYTYSIKNSDGIRFGNVLSHRVLFNYKAYSSCCDESSCSSEPNFISGLTLNAGYIFENQELSRKDGFSIQNTGGSRLFLNTGIKLTIKEDFLIPIQVNIPLAENLNGIQNSSMIRGEIGLSFLLH